VDGEGLRLGNDWIGTSALYSAPRRTPRFPSRGRWFRADLARHAHCDSGKFIVPHRTGRDRIGTRWTWDLPVLETLHL